MFNVSKKNVQRTTVGAQGEQFVAQFLEQQKYTVLARNFRTKMGEIDLIARKKNLIVFAEVKTRTTDYFELSQLIVPSKQRKIVATAAAFILENKLYQCIYRFDVALVVGRNPQFDLNYVDNAFVPDNEKWISASLF